jgi:flagellar biosynthesis protein FliR
VPVIDPVFGYAFLLVLVRTSTMLVSSPIFAHRGIPAMAKVGFSLFISLVLVPLNLSAMPPAPEMLGTLVDAVLREALLGLALGVAMNLVFQGLQLASRIIGLQMGFGMGGVVDPITGTDSGALDQFYMVLVGLVFFAVNGHYIVISALAETITAIPPGTFNPFAPEAFRLEVITSFALGLMVTAVRVAMPLMAALFLVDLGLGFVARTAPQVQVFVVGMPLKIGVGLIVLIAALPASAALMQIVIGGPLAGSSQQLLGVQ